MILGRLERRRYNNAKIHSHAENEVDELDSIEKTNQSKSPLPEAKPVCDYIHADEDGREYIIISRMVKTEDICGLEQFRRYLEPFDENDAKRTFIAFHKA